MLPNYGLLSFAYEATTINYGQMIICIYINQLWAEDYYMYIYDMPLFFRVTKQ